MNISNLFNKFLKLFSSSQTNNPSTRKAAQLKKADYTAEKKPIKQASPASQSNSKKPASHKKKPTPPRRK